MASRSHRWKGDDHPLTGVHGGTKSLAWRAVIEAKQAQFDRAREVSQAIIARNQISSDSYERQDRVRYRRISMARLMVSDLAPIHYVDPPIQVRWPRMNSAQREVWIKSGGVCVYCDKPMLRMPDDPLSFTIDHDLPRSRGGSNDIGNLVGAHARCNNEKGSLTGEEYRAVLAVRKARAR